MQLILQVGRKIEWKSYSTNGPKLFYQLYSLRHDHDVVQVIEDEAAPAAATAAAVTEKKKRTMTEHQKHMTEWGQSQGRQIVLHKLKTKEWPMEEDGKDWERQYVHEEVSKWGERTWPRRLELCRSKAKQIFENVKRDDDMVGKIMKKRKGPTTKNKFGKPVWYKSAASDALQAAYDQGRHLRETPSQICASNPLFEEFGSKRVRERIGQLKRKEKFQKYAGRLEEKKLDKIYGKREDAK